MPRGTDRATSLTSRVSPDLPQAPAAHLTWPRPLGLSPDPVDSRTALAARCHSVAPTVERTA